MHCSKIYFIFVLTYLLFFTGDEEKYIKRECQCDVSPELLKYQIHYRITPIKQEKSMDCWATVYTMMNSWRIKKHISVHETMVDLGSPWYEYYLNNEGLPASQERRFFCKVGLTFEPSANYLISFYKNALGRYGPLWITSGDGFNSHARLMVGLYGDGSYENTCLEFIDPKTGKVYCQRGLDFALEFEKEMRFIVDTKMLVELRIQVIHWGYFGIKIER